MEVIQTIQDSHKTLEQTVESLQAENLKLRHEFEEYKNSKETPDKESDSEFVSQILFIPLKIFLNIIYF